MSHTFFINYRRDDSSAEALLVRKALIDRFGARQVLENIYRVVRVYLSTWDADLHAVSDRDVQLARYFDKAYADFPGKAKVRQSGPG